MHAIKELLIHRDARVKKEWSALLIQENIRPEHTLTKTVGIYEEDRLIATGSIYRNILKCMAVSSEYQGENLLGTLITYLMNEVWDSGFVACYVYTTEKSSASFAYLGFKEIARVNQQLVFLEKAVRGIDDYISEISRYRRAGEASAIVMNANPFTNGHRYLIEQAAQNSNHVYVFVLSEDVSAFPFTIRKQLVEAGTAHLDNVTVLETGNYMVSAQTFPSYFLEEDADVTRVQATLDATIFKEKIASALNITTRYVGEEPFSKATAIYNEALAEVFGETIGLVVIARKQVADDVISATYVRSELAQGNLESVKLFVPVTTYEFLQSESASAIINKLMNGGK